MQNIESIIISLAILHILVRKTTGGFTKQPLAPRRLLFVRNHLHRKHYCDVFRHFSSNSSSQSKKQAKQAAEAAEAAAAVEVAKSPSRIHRVNENAKPSGTTTNREFWLDLRQSAVLPMEALQFLEQNLYQQGEQDYLQNTGQEDVENETDDSLLRFKVLSLIDRVLMSEDDFFKVVVSSPSKKTVPNTVKLMYATNDGQLIENDHNLNQSFPAGKITSCVYKKMIDPLTALEAITCEEGGGKWFLIETEDNKNASTADEASKNWFDEQISSLIQFVSSTSNKPSSSSAATKNISSLPSGLLVPMSISSSSIPSSSTTTSPYSAGGIAVRCPTRQAFLRLHNTVVVVEQSIGMNMITTTTTNSGILVPTGIVEDNTRGEETSVKLAFVIPFDVGIWETVKELVGFEDDAEGCRFY